ncbi:unnamed protein product [Brassicogethes aeneus]|uniref:Uncharacterized protein n=1 Tax=Brassicogethes aeneus TaxID=1431903 RepID=A0A9P0FI38_BRAAE|nr:unnamed protein product [Brassicogethes aeneus]
MWLRGLKVPKFRCFSTTTEPEGPCILSPIPGPCSTNLMNEMSCYQADLPAFNWPIAKFPQYKYPLEEFSCYNEQQDNKCLTSVRELIEKGRNDGCSVAGVIVEPIQDSNNNEASDKFIKTLQKICKENCCYFCIDETNTGCGATGTLWSHEQINLPEPPDAVTFSKKTQLSGFFHNIELNPQDGSRLQSTWSGDPSKLFMYESILNVIEKDYLLCTVNDTGCCLKNQLVKLQQNHPFIENIRGKGTFLAFDLKCPGMRNEILNNLKNRGILVKSCGEKGIAIRPALIFNQDHVGIFIENLNGILCDYKKAPVLNKHRKKKIPKYKPPCPEPCPEPPCNPCKPPPLPTCGICSPKKKKPC